MGDQEKSFHPHVLMLPWLSIGHVIPYVELAKRLCDRGIRVHLCSTASLLSLLNHRLQQNGYSVIETVEIRLPPTPGLLSRHDSTSSLPPHLMPHLKEAFRACKPTITNLLATLYPDFFIHDFFPLWAPDVAAELRIHAVQFVTFNISSFCTYYPHFMPTGSPLESIIIAAEDDAEAINAFLRWMEKTESVLTVRTSRSLEAKCLDYIRQRAEKAVLPVGMLLPQLQEDLPASSKFTDWLDTRRSRSVVFVAFGCEYSMTKEQIAEIALGLELSEQSFIWVIRLAREEEEEEKEEERRKMKRVLPSGFLERMKDKGTVMNGWAPQTAILSHPSTGGFLTHCGWGSLCEGMGYGVPFIALPLSLDQPMNARLVVGEPGLGVEVERERDGEFRRENVAEAIRRVMVGQEGEEFRRRGKEMEGKMESEEEGRVDELVRVMEAIYIEGNKN